MKKKKTVIAIILVSTWMAVGFMFRDTYMPNFQKEITADELAESDAQKSERAEYLVNTQKAITLAAQTIEMMDQVKIPAIETLEDQLVKIETVRPAIIAADNETIYYQINAASALTVATDLVTEVLEPEGRPISSAEMEQAILEAKQQMKKILNERNQLDEDENERLDS